MIPTQRGQVQVEGATLLLHSAWPAKLHLRGACLPNTCLRIFRQRVRSAGEESGTDRATSNGASRATEVDQHTVEMYVASSDDFNSSSGGRPATMQRSKLKRVTPPRVAPPRKFALTNKPEAEALQPTNTGEAKLLKAELSLTSAELKSKSGRLEESQRALRARESEVVLLRAALAERDIRLRSAKSELLSTQAALKDKDGELQNAYQQLMSSATERGELRQQILDTENELAETRQELDVWTQQASISGRQPSGAAHSTSESHPRKSRSQDADKNVAKLLADLTLLSQQVADNAQADEATFKSEASPS